SRCPCQPAAPAHDRRYEHAALWPRDPAQLHPRCRALRHLPRASSRYGDGGGSAPLPGRAARDRRARADHEQRGVGAAVLVHADAGTAMVRSGASKAPASAVRLTGGPFRLLRHEESNDKRAYSRWMSLSLPIWNQILRWLPSIRSTELPSKLSRHLAPRDPTSRSLPLLLG